MAKKILPSIVKQVLSKSIPNVNFATERVISHSQMTIYNSCPFRWKLQYKDRLKPFTDSINTIFGKAIHDCIQGYLDLMYKTSKIKADELDLEEIFKEKFKGYYDKSYKSNGNKHFSDPSEMREFFEDGMNILEYFKKKVSVYFGKRNIHFIGYELPINISPLNEYRGIKYYGFLDLVFYDESIEKFKIVDIKTSKSGWGKETKSDFYKRAQLLLYKRFFSEQYGVPIEDIEIEFFIVKRKLWEEADFPQKRIQLFTPPDGKNSINKASKIVNEFIESVFNVDNSIKDKVYKKTPSGKNCFFCPFKDDRKICDKNPF